MNSKEIKQLIQNGEKIDVEFKESKNALTKDVFDTVCSFNNRNGGHILLGVNDKREIVGVSKDKVDKVIKEFPMAINNSQKMYSPLYLQPEVFEKVIRYVNIVGKFGTGLMKDPSILQLIQNLYISDTQENRAAIL